MKDQDSRFRVVLNGRKLQIAGVVRVNRQTSKSAAVAWTALCAALEDLGLRFEQIRKDDELAVECEALKRASADGTLRV